MDDGQLKEVLMDVRQAQRLLVAFYKRVMPLIKNISADLKCEHFYYWNPIRFNRPANGTNNPLDGRWEWDMMPMADTYFMFTSEPLDKENRVVTEGTWMLVVKLVTDSGTEAFSRHDRNWNPLKFEDVEHCETRLELYGYQLLEGIDDKWDFWNLWKNNQYTDLSGQLNSLDGKGAFFGCKVNLEGIQNSDSLETDLAEFKQRLVDYQFTGG